jgi:hypothetical protein
VEAVAGFLAALGAGLGDVGAVRRERFVHDPVVLAGFAAAAALDQGEVSAGFGEEADAGTTAISALPAPHLACAAFLPIWFFRA